MNVPNTIGFKACWKLVPRGRCRKPVGHEGDCAGVKFEGDRQHRWKLSWPGNFCLDCGYSDPSEDLEKSIVTCPTCKGDTVVNYGIAGVEPCWDCSSTGCVVNPNMVWEPCSGPSMIIFLDFDGVLHPIPSEPKRLFEQSPRIRDILVKYKNVFLVVHSSWRMSSSYDEEDIWDFLEIEDALRPRFLGITSTTEPSRWESIQSWIKSHNYTGEYVILDDMYTSFDGEGRERLISPRYDVGMQEADWKELERRLDAHLQS